VCANKRLVPFGAQKDTTIGEIVGIWKKHSSYIPMARMHWSLVWSNFRTRRFVFVQIKFLKS